MEQDARVLYSIIRSRDERFDGRFIMAVLTTGVYCRPVCPAPTPKYENVRFFASAAAAAEAGYRPCLRCRPELAPDIGGWHSGVATVNHGLRLIAEGVVDEKGVNGLAHRLGITERHLRRLFHQHLGASPLGVVQTQRFHLAKKLINETSLPLTEVAFCSGYASIRRFNGAFKKAYGRPPSALRRRQLARATPPDNAVRITLPYKQPFQWAWFTRYLATRALSGVEHVTEDVYRRSVRLGEVTGVIEVRPVPDQPQLQLTVPATMTRGLAPLIERVRRLFDLRANPQEISRHLVRDAALAAILKRHPTVRVPGCWDAFELAVRAVLGQSISVKAATTLGTRLAARYGEPLEARSAQAITHVFPRPEDLRRARFNDIGLSRGRAEALRALADAATRDENFFLFSSLSRAIDTLTALPGIGQWTANYIAMRALGEPDAFPAGDLVLRRAAAGNAGAMMTEAALLARAESWRPWRAYAAVCLWNSTEKT